MPGQPKTVSVRSAPAKTKLQRESGHGHRRQQRIPQRVPEEDDVLAVADRSRGRDEVLAHDLDHARARQAHVRRQRVEEESRRGKCHVPSDVDEASEALARRRQADHPRRWQPAQPYREYQDQEQAGPEDRHGIERQADRGDRVVDLGWIVASGVRAEQRAQYDRGDLAREDEQGRCGKAFHDHFDHGSPVGERVAEVSLEQRREIRAELLEQWLVETVVDAERFDELLRRALAGERRGWITRRQVDEQEVDHRDEEHHGEDLHHAAQRVAPHGLRPRAAAGVARSLSPCP